MKNILLIVSFLFISCPLWAQRDILIKQAEEGVIEAQLYLAKKYMDGSNEYQKSPQIALDYYLMAANQGNPEAQYEVFNCLSTGIGTDVNKDEADKWLVKAAEQHYPAALLRLGIERYAHSQFKEAIRYLTYYKDEIQEHPFVWEIFGTCYLEGLGVNQDYKLSALYFKKAVNALLDATKEFGDNAEFPELMPGYSAYRLAEIYQNGLGESKDIDMAKKLYFLALSRNQNIPMYYEGLGSLFVEQGDVENARKLWNRLLLIDEDAFKSASILAMAMGGSIDYIIPQYASENNNILAIVIANENYKRVPNVPHAINDGAVVKKYLLNTFGVPEENIEYLEDASLNDIKFALTNVSQKCEGFKDKYSVIVYYAGHGVPDEKSSEAFLLPVDGFGTDPSSGLALDDFYNSLSQLSAKSVIVILDACFSGAKRDGGMLMATRGITIKPKMQVPDGKLIVFSATSEDQTAFPIEEQKHGLFTYTLLRKIQETEGNITWGELADYVSETVKNRSVDLVGKLQSPSVSVSSSLKATWRNLNIR